MGIKEKKITILIKPVSMRSNCKILYKRYIRRAGIYDGHPAVTRSLIEGLVKIGFQNFNYQPARESEIGEYVHVLAGVDTLKYAIRLKQRGIIKKLTAGPNVVVFSTDFESLIANPSISLYLQPSDWTVRFHIDMEPKLKGRCKCWPAGVDSARFCPEVMECYSRIVLVYSKGESEQFCYHVIDLLNSHGYRVKVIRCGNYRMNEYIKLLNQCEFVVTISNAESQGIFLAEAWAMNRPTLCYDPHFYHWKINGSEVTRRDDISAAPYLTDRTGHAWRSIDELESLINQYKKNRLYYGPRKWVLENRTDEVCARDFLAKVNDETIYS